MGVAVLLILLCNRSLESAAANGDTRTLSLHHIHTGESITVTYKRDGHYDEEALKRLDYFLRDWRKNQTIRMDPRLFDVLWEVSREFGKDKVIQVVCGYRSPSTNAMLRQRSRGVAQSSQHTLGKAIDFYIPGVPLEQLREAGMRLQRGGVGFYPTSGSPFVHMDVGSVRYWPRMTREQLARVFPDGRTVDIPSDGRPLPGYALALADIVRRGSSPPSQMSLAAAHLAGVDISSVGISSAGTARPKNILAASFHTDDEEDEATRSAPAATATVTARHSYNLASVADSDARTAPKRGTAAARSQRTAPAAAVAPTGDDGMTASAAAGRNPWATVGVADVTRRPTEIHAPMSDPDHAPAVAPWPFPDADKDHVPLDLALAYATEPRQGATAHSDAVAGRDAPHAASGLARSIRQRDGQADENGAGGPKDGPGAGSATAPVAPVIKVVVATATPGMRYDDPWLRAMMLAPRLYDSMTATLFGDPDFTELRSLMTKPATAVAMAFSNDPYPGIKTNCFSGKAIVRLSVITFSQKTAWLQQY